MRQIKIFNIEIRKSHIIALAVALVVSLLSLIFLRGSDIFYLLLGISFLIAGLPFIISLILEGSTIKEKEAMFLEFSRNLVESVKAGTPISKSIMNIKGKDYGSLSPYINKLANQISLGIPIKTSFETFARDINSRTITRAVTIIGESEKAGGNIADILESVVKSVSQIEKLRKERAASIYAMVVQGYIIFFIFIIIMLVMEFKILPIAAGLGSEMGSTGDSNLAQGLSAFSGGVRATPEELAKPFIWLLVVQGFFTGLVIGKLSEGKIRDGIKHSFILVVLALLIKSSATLLLK